jgi:outer membrane immunogenic protein
MRRTLAALAAVLSTTCGLRAGDLPPSYPAPAPTAPAVVAPPAGYSWTGVYLGIYSGDTFSTVTGPVNAVQDNGWVWGGIVGANYQMGNAVLSVEADYGATFNGSAFGATGIESIGNVRGRIGWAFDRFHLFAAAGGSFADLRVTSFFGNSTTAWYAGWTVGGGIEYAAWWGVLTRLEYLYASYGSQTINVPPSIPVSVDVHTIRGALLWKF